VSSAKRSAPCHKIPGDKRSRDSGATTLAKAPRVQHENGPQATKPSTVDGGLVNPKPSPSTTVNSNIGSSSRLPKLKRADATVNSNIGSSSRLPKLKRADAQFTIGEAVQCREKGAVWKEGVVVSLEPLHVKPVGWKSAFPWHEVKKKKYCHSR